ncbi:hypothetical protein [Bacteroides acidifaciens]|uniref:hypothetical protein n=1 Tax=Bacteroides acidifaciens TaxID=85831 RepID=UPI0025B52A3E|nr:hypothetical protein [Bacteroides acidifaciens]
METTYTITLTVISLLFYKKDHYAMDFIRTSLVDVKYTQLYLLLSCILLFIAIINRIKSYQKAQKAAAIKKQLCKELEIQRAITEEHAATISLLQKGITSLTEQKNVADSSFPHTNILHATEYDKFIHYFQISNPCLLSYLKSPEFKLTSYEIVLCLFAYLNTSSSHIEYLLNKKHDTLKKARQRIKVKMQIDNKDNIGNFLREKMR